MPLLNRAQLVTSWREMLPLVRDTEARSIPLDLPGEGVYVVEAVNGPFKAYTIVIVSDLGLVTKASPARWSCSPPTGSRASRAAGCAAQVIANRAVVATGTLDADGVYAAVVPETRPDDVVAVVRCGKQVAATDPGSWMFQPSTKDLVGYIYTDKPIYRPGHTVNIKGVLRWRIGGQRWRRSTASRSKSASTRPQRQGRATASRSAVDEFGGRSASLPVPRGAALGDYAIRIASGDDRGDGQLRSPGIPQARIRSHR